MTNEINSVLREIVNKKEQVVFKGMRPDMETGKALLNPEQLTAFLREATLPQVLLSQADLKIMKSFKKELSRVGVDGRVLTNGYDASGNTRPIPDGEKAKLKFGANILDAKKLKACAALEDDEKEDNLEQGTFEQTLLGLMGEQIGSDIEFWALYSDTSISDTTNQLLHTADGWLKKSGNKLDSASDFDLTTTGVEGLFDAMIQKLPANFRQRNNIKFFVPFEVDDAYRNLLKERGTPLGDTTQTGFNGLSYKGISIEHVPTLDDETGRDLSNNKVSTMLVDPKNLAYGIWKNMTIEPKRVAELEKTEYYYRMRGDIDYYFRNGVVSATMTETEAQDIINFVP